MNRVFIFTDLDDTLFSSRWKQQSEYLHPAALLKDGQPVSFTSPKQRLFIELLTKMGEIVPTTARNIDSFNRVLLQFPGRYAVLSNGAIILQDGVPEKNWLQKSRDTSEQFAPRLQQLLVFLEQEARFVPAQINNRIIYDYGLPLYVLSKCSRETYDGKSLDILEEKLKEQVDLEGMFIHRNHNNLAVYPHTFDKEAAVRYLQEEIMKLDENDLSIGIGDSMADFSFLTACDFAIAPSRSQIISMFKSVIQRDKQ